jgi:hypothetical protein
MTFVKCQLRNTDDLMKYVNWQFSLLLSNPVITRYIFVDFVSIVHFEEVSFQRLRNQALVQLLPTAYLQVVSSFVPWIQAVVEESGDVAPVALIYIRCHNNLIIGLPQCRSDLSLD